MHLVKRTAIVIGAFFLFGLGTMHMWTHPAFLLLLVGAVSYIYNKLRSQPIQRRYVS